MKEQEAIKAIKIKEMQIECKATRMLEFCEGLVMAEEALEKQIPKKVENGECPICEEPIPRWDSKYCPACGQKLDWGE